MNWNPPSTRPYVFISSCATTGTPLSSLNSSCFGNLIMILFGLSGSRGADVYACVMSVPMSNLFDDAAIAAIIRTVDASHPLAADS